MIVAFTKDWNDVPTCTTHILREMAKSIPVLWVESIGTRRPNLAVGSKDIGRVVNRLKCLLKGPEWKENVLWVLSPLIIPKASKPWELTVNRILFRLQERAAMRKMKRRLPPISDLRLPIFEYWCFVPNAVDLVPSPSGGNEVIYYCVDDWTQFHNLDGKYLGEKERQLVSRANIIFAASRFLEKKLQTMINTTDLRPPPARRSFGEGESSVLRYMPHGVEHAKFAAALSPDTTVPEDIAAIPYPIVGFYGNLHSWVDLGLVSELAQRKTEWQFVLIGHPYDDVSAVESLPNVHLLGRREHDDLPAYCRAFDIAIIPYDMTQARMESVNPVKTKELLAAGCPIVAAAVPELENMSEDILIARSADEWIAAIEQQLARKDRQAISGRVLSEDWTPKVQAIRGIVDAA